MSFHEMTEPAPGIATHSALLAQAVARTLGVVRTSFDHWKIRIDSAPGGKLVLCADLGTATCQELVDIMGSLATCANAHLPAGVTAVVPPLVQADVPT